MNAALFSMCRHIIRYSGKEILFIAFWLGLVAVAGIELFSNGAMRLKPRTEVLVDFAAFGLVFCVTSLGGLVALTLLFWPMCTERWRQRHGEVVLGPDFGRQALRAEVDRRQILCNLRHQIADLPLMEGQIQENIILLGGEARLRDELISRFLRDLRSCDRKIIVFDPNCRLVSTSARDGSDLVFDLGNCLEPGWDPVAEGMTPREFACLLTSILPKGPIASDGARIVKAAYAHLHSQKRAPTLQALREILQVGGEALKAVLIDHNSEMETTAEGIRYGLDLISNFERAAGNRPVRLADWVAGNEGPVLFLSLANARARPVLEAMLGLAIGRSAAQTPDKMPHLVFVHPPKFGDGLAPTFEELLEASAPVCLCAGGFAELRRSGLGPGLNEFISKFSTRIFLAPSKAEEGQELARHLAALALANHTLAQKAWWRRFFPRVGKVAPPPPPKSTHDLIAGPRDIAIVCFPSRATGRPLPVIETVLPQRNQADDAQVFKVVEGPIIQAPPEPAPRPPAPTVVPGPTAPLPPEPRPAHPGFGSAEFADHMDSLVTTLFNARPLTLPFHQHDWSDENAEGEVRHENKGEWDA